MKKYLYLILLLLLCNSWVFGQSVNKLSSYEGINFYISFMQNDVLYSGEAPPANTLDLLISSTQNASIEVRFQNKLTKYNLAANTVERISFDRSVVLYQSEIISDLGINITSDVPITIYGFNSIKRSSDMFSVIPVQNWGTEYYVMSYPNDIYRGYTDMIPQKASMPRKSQFCVIANYDNTKVRITPKVQTHSGKPANSEFSVTLNKGETYLVQSSDVTVGGDLSGSHIVSDKPIGCFSGHVRTGILQSFSFPWASKDHLVEMLTPVSSWGQAFITTPFLFANQKNGNLFRFTSATANTTVLIRTASGVFSAYSVPNPGDIVEIDNLHEAAIWESSSPIQIMQLMCHTADEYDTPIYDPSMSGVPPLEQFVPKIIFQIPNNTVQNPRQFISHTAMLVIEKKALNTIRYDRERLVDRDGLIITKMPNIDYYWTRFTVLPGSHTFVADSGRFSGVLYGNGDEDSYSLVLGTSLLPPNMNDTVKPILVVDSACGRIKGQVSEVSDGVNNSGLNYIYVNKATLKNYTYSIKNLNDTSTVYYFDAEIINKEAEAHIEVIGRDRANNEFGFVYHYYPLKAQYSSTELSPEPIDWKSKPCYDNWVLNNSLVPYTLQSITTDNPKIQIVSDKSLPYTLAVGERINYQICIDPSNQYVDISGNVTLLYECGKSMVIPVDINVTAIEIIAEGYNFGSVYVDKDSCAYIKIHNSGKEDILIQGITLEQNSAKFEYFTQSKFPMTIKSGQSDSIKVCFTPSTKGTFVDKVAIRYNSNQIVRVEVKGEGINPELSDLHNSFGNKRIGTNNEYEFVIANTGNVEANIKYYNTEIASDEFNIDEFKAINMTIKPNYDFRFKVNYNPKTVGIHTLKANYIIDNDVTKIYTLTLDGTGTIPTIETPDIYLGETRIFSKLNKNIDITKAGGNEPLQINSIKIIGGNTTSFDLDLSKVQNKTLLPDESINLPIEFHPQFVGLHSINVEIVSDAAENYKLVADTFKITAGSRAVDTTGFELSINAPNSILACNDYDIQPRITNSGNVDLTITSLIVNDPNLADGFWVKPLDAPIILNPGQSESFIYRFTPTAHENGKFIFTFGTNGGELSKDIEYSFTAITSELQLTLSGDKQYLPGDTINISIIGKHIHKTSTTINSNLTIETNRFGIRLINGNYLLKINNNFEYEEISLDLEQKNNYIDIPIIDNKVLVNNDVNWQLDLKFRAYLIVDTFNIVNFKYKSDKCFDEVRESIKLVQTPFCINDLRPVTYVPNPKINSRYNDASGTLEIEIETYSDDKVNFEIYNSLGELVKTMNSIELKKGNHKLSLDMNETSSGVYVLYANGIKLRNNKIFIKK